MTSRDQWQGYRRRVFIRAKRNKELMRKEGKEGKNGKEGKESKKEERRGEIMKKKSLFSFLCVAIIGVFFVTHRDEIHAQANTEVLTPAVQRDLASLVVQKTVTRGEMFSLKFILERENDVMLIGKMDESQITSISVTRELGEVLFVFLAKETGESDLIVDKISQSLQSPFIRYRIKVIPSVADRERMALEYAEEKKKETEAEKLNRLVSSLIAEGQVQLANQMIAEQLPNIDPSQMTAMMLEKIFDELMKRELISDFDPTLEAARAIFVGNENEALFRFIEAKVSDAKGDRQKAISILLDVMENNFNEKKPKKESYLLFNFSKILFLLGDLFFRQEEYGSSRARFNEFISLQPQLSQEQRTKHVRRVIEAYFLLAEGFEKDDNERDIKDAIRHYEIVQDLTTTIDFNSEDANAIEELREQGKKRITYLREFFIHVK